MDKGIFNTSFEVSLRILIVLGASPRESATVDKAAAVDFIATYGREFGLAQKNLHGDGFLKYSEFAHRRSLTQEAIKKLGLKGYIVPELTPQGFSYLLTNQGKAYYDSLSSNYAVAYRALCEAVWERFSDATEEELVDMINRSANSSIRRKEADNGSILP